MDTVLIANPNRVSGTLLVNIAVGAGFIGYSLMALEFALISRMKAAAQPFGEDRVCVVNENAAATAPCWAPRRPNWLVQLQPPTMPLCN